MDERAELIQCIGNMSEIQWTWFLAEARKLLAIELEKKLTIE